MERFPVRKHIRLPLPVYSQNHPFFITIATHRKYPWFQLYPHLTEALVKVMRDLARPRRTTIYAWCIMPNHVHLLLEENDLIDFIRLLKGKASPRARPIEPHRRLWQRSFFDHALRKEEALSQVASYIWENPVRAGIVQSPTEYRWSGSEVWPEWREFYIRP